MSLVPEPTEQLKDTHLRFLESEQFQEMLDPYKKLKPLEKDHPRKFKNQMNICGFGGIYPLMDSDLQTHDLSTPKALADAVTVSGTPETVTFAAALLDIFDKTVTARMQEYAVLGNSPAAYFICGVWANKKRGRKQAKNGNANPVLLSQLSYQKTGKSAKIRNDFDKKSFRIFLKKSSAAQIAAACRMASACPPAVQWHDTAFQ